MVKNKYLKEDKKKGLPSLLNQKMVLSRNLIFSKTNKSENLLINMLSLTALKPSDSLLTFLRPFKEKPILLSSLMPGYEAIDLIQYATELLKRNFLIPESINEDYEWLINRLDMNITKQFETRHFITLYSVSHDYLTRNFSDFMEKVFSYLSKKNHWVLKHKIIIYICKDRSEFKGYWGDNFLPAWPDAFVFSSNLMIIDPQKIKQKDNNNSLLQGMAHELCHIFINQMGYHLPIWAEEGLCEYLSKSNSKIMLRAVCGQKKIYGLKEIELFAKQSLLDLDDSRVKENICYRQSHSFISYLIDLKGKKHFFECVKSTGLEIGFESQLQKFYNQSLQSAELAWQKGIPQMQVARLKASKNLRIIKNSSFVLLYNAFYGQSLKSSSDILYLIEQFKKGSTINELSDRFDLENLDSIITKLRNKKLIIFDYEKETNKVYRDFDHEKIIKGSLINKLRLNMSNSCNMACDYCYADPDQAEQMDWQTAKKALIKFFNLQEQTGQSHSQIRFFGGEALLNWSVIEKVFDYVKCLANHIEVEYILNTNGTVLTKDIAQKLSSNNVNISVSIDGLKKVNDTFRRFKSGKGSFLKINKNMDILVSSGCNVAVSTTIGNHNYNNLKELITYIADKNTKYNSKITLSLQSMCMESKQELDTVPVEEKINAVKKAVLYAIDVGVNVSFGMLMFPLNSLLGLKNMGAYCNAVSGEEICIYPNGDIYPCGALKTKMGSIGNFNAIFKTKEYLNLVKRVTGNIPKCKGCDIESFCSGGCAADAAIGNNIFARTKNCRFEQLFFKSFAIEYLNRMLE